MRHWIAVSLLMLIGPLLAGCATPRPILTGTLLAEMTNLAGMAEFPDPPFTCKQFSSYDRKSKSPEEDWFANADCGQYLRVEEWGERKEYVMMDAKGPGAIVRIWSANPKGTLRIYLDGNETPVIEAPMTDLLSGESPGIPEPIAHTASAGWNCYFPFPYAKHCKVTSDEGGFYYHVNYRTYPPGTHVETFKATHLQTYTAEIQQVANALKLPREALTTITGSGDRYDRYLTGPKFPRIELAPGSEHELMNASGPGAIGALRIVVQADQLERALRQVLLTAEFDGEETVRCPIGDFFGAAPGISPYTSLPMGVTKEGVMWSHWVMPFRESARITLRNMGDRPVSLASQAHLVGHLRRRPYTWTDRSMHFYAQWRSESDVPTRPMQDWNYVDIKGRGVFAGAAFAIANPVRHWWGEGDEKIYVDGETFPSHFGTGTEDYYGYAWCNPALFTHAYHNQPRCDGPGNYGHTAVNRWHIIDRIPFTKSFRFDMELWHSHRDTRVTMSVVTYWYARPGATSNRMAIEPADLRIAEIPPYVAPRVAGALEGEEMRIVEKTGSPARQGIPRCSNEQHLWWREAQPGEKLVLAFPAPAAGRYRVHARFLTAADYGVMQLRINDDNAGEPMDFYNDGVLVMDEKLLGEFDLKAGENRFTAEIVGANEKAVKNYMFGLDYLRLEPVP